MTIQGEKENCQIKYKGGGITALRAEFNSIRAIPGWVPGFIIQFTFVFLYVPNCYNLHNCSWRQTSSPDFSNIYNIVICKQRIRSEKGQEKLEGYVFCLDINQFFQKKSSLERNVRKSVSFRTGQYSPAKFQVLLKNTKAESKLIKNISWVSCSHV